MATVSTGRSIGLSAVNLETGETVIRTCTGTMIPGPKLTTDQAERAYIWATGVGPLIQVALPDISDDAREMLISGTSSDAYDEMFKETDDDA